MLNKIKFTHQRITRGFADADAWNADMFLAGQIAGILRWIVEDGHGVATSYADDWNTDVDIMAERRDKDYLHYANLFAEYAKNGIAYNESWKEQFGGLLDTEIDEALQWFREHFLELWD